MYPGSAMWREERTRTALHGFAAAGTGPVSGENLGVAAHR